MNRSEALAQIDAIREVRLRGTPDFGARALVALIRDVYATYPFSLVQVAAEHLTLTDPVAEREIKRIVTEIEDNDPTGELGDLLNAINLRLPPRRRSL